MSPTTGPRPRSKTLSDFALVSPATRIVSGALGVVAGEHFLVFADRSRVLLAEALIDLAAGLKARTRLVVLEDANLPTDDHLVDFVSALLVGVEASVLLVGTEHSQPLRRAFVEATVRLMVRHAHMVGFSERGFIEGFAVDASRVSDMLQAVGRRLAGAQRLSYQTPAGTKLEIKIPTTTRWAERGQLIRPGKFSNLPGGQLNALAEEVDGVFVANGSSNVAFRGSGDLRTQPITFTIAHGVVQTVSCPDLVVEGEVKALIGSEEHANRVGHLVVGANPGIMHPIGEVMVDACAPGLQLVFGFTNQGITGATWSSRTSLAVAGSSGDLDVDGAALLRGGRYVL